MGIRHDRFSYSLRLLSFALAMLTPAVSSGTSSEPIWAMGVIGDSISAATFADISISSTEPDSWERFRDWIRTGFKSDFLVQNRDSLSWASGSRIQSHKALLEAALQGRGIPGKLTAINVAEPNANASDSIKQAGALVQRYREGQFEGLLYVTYFIGSNDACSSKAPGGTPNDQMRASIFAALRELSAVSRPERPVRILMSSIPPIPDLGSPEIKAHSTILGLKCRDLREEIMGVCKPLLNWSTEAEYAERMRIVEEKNALLEEIAREANDRFPTMEVVFSDRVFRHRIDVNELAADCFHPGRAGQERLAKELWQDQPWF